MDGKKFLFWAALAGGGIWLLSRKQAGIGADIALSIGADVPPYELIIGDSHILRAEITNQSSKGGTPIAATFVIEATAVTNLGRNIINPASASVALDIAAGGMGTMGYNLGSAGTEGEFGTITVTARAPDNSIVATVSADFTWIAVPIYAAQINLVANW